MRKTLTLLAFLLLSISAFAQNWDPIKPATRNYFTNAVGYLKATELDSIIGSGSDLLYYPYKRHKFSSGGLWIGNNGPDTIGSWIGKLIIRKPNGDYLFVNHWNDTILIKAKASPGDTWTFHHHGTKYYTAEITSVDTMTILGSLDSVKKILLHAYDGSTSLTAESFESAEIVLSKAHGFQATMELYYFPFHEPDTSLVVDDYFLNRSLYTYDDYSTGGQLPGKHRNTFHLTGLPNPPASQFIDWNVGDIHQYDACFNSSLNFSTTCQPSYNYRLDTIISKAITTQGVEYIRRGWKAVGVWLTNNVGSHYILWPFQDTVFIPATGEYFSESLNDTNAIGAPEKIAPLFLWMPTYHHYYLPSDTTYCRVSPAYYKRSFFFGGLTAGMQFYAHKQGIGLVSNEGMWYDNTTAYSHNTLIYSKRNGIECGTYIFPDTSAPVVNSVTSVNTDAFKIYPNPANHQLSIETSETSYNLSLLNSIGQVVFAQDNYNGKQVIKLETYDNGIYVLRLTTANGHRIDKKIVIQN